MDVSFMRSEFTVFVVDRTLSEAQSLVASLKTAGYSDTRFYPTLDSALAVIQHNPPHLLLFDYERYEDVAERFLIDLQATSAEIVTILMATSAQSLQALQMVSRGLAYDTLLRPLNSTLEVIQKLDRACERLFFQFESEQIKERMALAGHTFEEDVTDSTVWVSMADLAGADDARSAGALPSDLITGSTCAANSSIEETRETNSALNGVRRMNDFLARMNTLRETDASIQAFMDAFSLQLSDAPVLYLRYLPSHMSLLLSHSSKLPAEKIRGIGIDLKKEDISQIPKLLAHPSQLTSLHELVSRVFLQKHFSAFTHQVDGDSLGIFVVLTSQPTEGGDAGLFRDPVLVGLKQIFDLAYKRNLTLKEKHVLDVLDPLTGLVNRRHLSQKISEEISRSRRIRLPLAIVTIDIDNFKNLNERIGSRQADSVLKMVAMILKKTARVSDIVARSGPDEVVLLLPHTNASGAMIKAERMRRMIEATRFPILQGLQTDPLTISCGVSEYPSFCNDAEGLVRSADEALIQVKRAGGNMICLTKASPGFQMDFTPQEVPAATGGPRAEETK